MGRIRTTSIKNISRELLNMYPDDLGSDFISNKEFLKDLIESKKLRNKIAGYIVNLKRHAK
ncbi:MAG: 30S ribosomal protein S17e [Candidatus Aenigmarchaeota archaeon]|nr:30S ribosomal protein S17e [Candidatus Aenigmarchaeota archaeon]